MNRSFLSLYSSILVPILSEWINNEDLCFLDTAVCSKELRNSLLRILSMCYVDEEVEEPFNDCYMSLSTFRWMILRRLRVKKLHLSNRLVAVNPCVNSILCSRHLQHLTLQFGDLEMILRKFHLNVSSLAIDWQWLYNGDLSVLKIVGPLITRINFGKHYPDINGTIAACCPNMKEVSAFRDSIILPFVYACELEIIEGCVLRSLIERVDCDSRSYSCDLKRASVGDSSTVCLGEGKHYHMTRLHCKSELLQRDVQQLAPLVHQAREMQIAGRKLLVAAAALECRYINLTKLSVVDGTVCVDDLKLVFSTAYQLRHLILSEFRGLTIDDCLAVVAECCPLLEECDVSHCRVVSSEVMSALFVGCIYLTSFIALSWPHESLVHYAVNVEKLVFDTERQIQKSGRGNRQLELPDNLTEIILSEILTKNGDLRSVDFEYYEHTSCALIEAMAQWCPSLTDIKLTRFYARDSVACAAIGSLLHLRALSARFSYGFTKETFGKFLTNKSKLLILDLSYCDLYGKKLRKIAKYCPALTNLDLTENTRIQNGDIIKLLKGLNDLQTLSLLFCSDISADILSSIKCPPMRFLGAVGTNITEDDMKCFESVDGFKYRLKACE